MSRTPSTPVSRPCASRARAPWVATSLALAAIAAVAAPLAMALNAPAAAPAIAPAEAGVRVTQAWIRWLPANLPAGGYLTLVNARDQPVSLVAVRSNAYGSVALHRTVSSSGGISRMLPVSAIVVPAHGTLDFAALGYHLMLEQARGSIKPGEQLPLLLQFSDGGVLRVLAQVKPPTALPSMPGMADMPGMSH